MRRWRDARRAFAKALDIDGDSARAHDGMAAALLGRGCAEEAAEEALIAVGLIHHFPEAHFRLGAALARLGWTDRAIQALKTCLSMRPKMPAAHRLLAKIYEEAVGDETQAAEHRRLAREPVAVDPSSALPAADGDER